MLFLIPMAALTAETVTLTLEDAVKRALDQNLNLKKEAINVNLTGYAASRLWSEIFPAFNLSAGFGFLPNTPLFTEPGFRYRDEELSYSINFGLSLSLNTSIRSSMKRIELAYRAQLLKYEDACTQLELMVIKYFLDLVTKLEYISYMEESLNLAEQKLAKDRIARENGLFSELDWLNSRLNAETALYNLSTAKGTYQNFLDDFLALLGMDPDTVLVYRGTVDIVPLLFNPEQLIMEYLPKRPDIIMMRQNIEMLELTKNVTSLNSRSPTLELGTQWYGGTPTSGLRSGLNDPFTDNIAGSVTLRIPIDSWIPGTRGSQNIRSAAAEVEKARLDLQDTEISAKTQIRSLISNLANTWESLEIARLRVEIAQRTVETTEEGFDNGTIEFQELQDRRNDLTDARQRLLQGEFGYQCLLLDLAAAINVEWKALIAGEQPGPPSRSVSP